VISPIIIHYHYRRSLAAWVTLRARNHASREEHTWASVISKPTAWLLRGGGSLSKGFYKRTPRNRFYREPPDPSLDRIRGHASREEHTRASVISKPTACLLGGGVVLAWDSTNILLGIVFIETPPTRV